nr:ATP-binding protein [Natronocella acetinitrilica]
MKSDFVANVSHELRTPLTMLLAPIEDIDRSPLVRNTENEPRARIAKKNAQQLLALVDNLLEVIRLREVPETPPTTPVHLSDQLESFCEMAAYQAERRGIRIDTRIAPEVWVRGNTDALEKVLYNLIGNALKYAQSEGEIRIELAHEDGSARLVVSDTGPGIRDEVLPQVLARFRRGHVAGDRDPGGSGIGLALSRELIEAMGGHLEIASEYGRGTRVSVSLRSSPPAAPAAMPPPPGGAEADAGDSGEGAPVAARDVGRGRVLIVDDNPEVRHYIAATLAEEFDCLSVGTAEETLAAVHREPFDLILLDWILGGDDGLALAGAIREGRTDTHTRIVILSARSDRDSALLALREGADEFIAKPFGTRELLERVRNIVRTVRLEREIVARNTVLEQMIEQLNATQEQLVHSEKMNALGRLSAGLLHEVRNPLNYVSMATQVLKRSPAMRDAAEAREILTDIEEGVNRVSAIVSDLKEFSHPSAVQFADTPVAQIVDSALKFTRHEAGAIVLGQRVEAGLHAHCSQPHVVQVLVNLLANAIRSLQGDTRVQAPEIEISASRRAEGWIEIRVCDNGRGMDEAALDQVFEPFYTTATAGSGIGMGLPICQTIITRHGGVIRAESIPYVRTCFTFTLPASAAQAITESVNEAG